MPFAVVCPHCHHQGYSRVSPIGKRTRCPQCNGAFVPAAMNVSEQGIAERVCKIEPASTRVGPTVSIACPTCGRAADPAQTYCSHCEEPLAQNPNEAGNVVCPGCGLLIGYSWKELGEVIRCSRCGEGTRARRAIRQPAPPPKLTQCSTCGCLISPRAKTCPQCGEGLVSAREVSGVWTFFFGCFYFLAKGWVKAALAAFVIALFTAGLSWFVIPFFAQKFVDGAEGN
jgi:hypothetical protein